MPYHLSVQPIAFILSTNDSLAERAFKDVPTHDLWTRPTPQSNPMLWIFGHIVHMRGQMVRLLGGEFEADWGDAFSRGAALQDTSSYPTRERLAAVLRDVNAHLYGALAALGAEDVAKPASRAFSPAVKTLGDQLSFLTMHDTYHTGQLGYVRKALGLPGVVG